MKELNAIKAFVLSLEANKLSDEQQAILLVGESNAYGGINTSGCVNDKCKNSSPSCAADSNTGCTNVATCTCPAESTGSTGSTSNTECTITNTCQNTTCSNPGCIVNTCGTSSKAAYGTMGFPGFGII